MAEIRARLTPDETVKAIYRATKRALRNNNGDLDNQARLQSQLEFLERLYLF
jgi:hypothetical protein